MKKTTTQIKILIEGYAKKIGSGFQASSTTCLITTEKGKKIITDPGCHREKLLDALKNENLTCNDIDYVFLSHQHPDHILLAGIFEKAKYITFDTNLIYDQDILSEFKNNILGDEIKILDTPGHVLEHLSLLVNTKKGKVVIAGDVIWWLDDEEEIFNINQKDHSEAKGMNMKKLIESRKKIIQLADYIIPGHGKMFQVDKKIKEEINFLDKESSKLNEKEEYEIWNTEKQKINQKKVEEDFYINPREIWFTKMGKNIGFEENGKDDFLRPVLVLKKIGALFLTVALTSKGKDNNYFYYKIQEGNFNENNQKNKDSSYLIFSQLKSMDKKRFTEKMGYVNKEEFKKIKEKIKARLL